MAAFDNPTQLLSMLSVGETFAGRYEIVAKLGAGGMSSVFQARDRLAGDVVALKVLDPQLARDSRMSEQFRKELLGTRRLSHRNVIRIHDIGEHSGALFISMEFIDGDSLAALQARRGRFTEADFRPIFNQFCEALGYVHSQHLVHRDIKALNVMLDRNGCLKLMDFGIAREVGGERTQILMGTPSHMAPELFNGQPATPASDIYSTGVMLFELLTGAKAGADPDWSLCHDVPAAWRDLVRRCLDLDPARRFQSADELLRAAPCSDARPEIPGRDKEERIVQPRFWISGRGWILGLLLLCLGSSGGVYIQHRMTTERIVEPTVKEPVKEVKPTLPPAMETATGTMQLAPAGEFLMGSDSGRRSVQYGYHNEAPAHTVTLPDFYIDKFEVTNALYKKFCDATKRKYPEFPSGSEDYFSKLNFPVINVSWDDARAYAAWAGKRLPSEAEWEKAARGADGRRYPWGEDPGPARLLPDKGQAEAVGSHPEDASPFGVMDMAGNVPEWVEDSYRLYAGNPALLPDHEAGQKVVRGVFFHILKLSQTRLSNRASAPPAAPAGKLSRIGFRCAADAAAALRIRTKR